MQTHSITQSLAAIGAAVALHMPAEGAPQKLSNERLSAIPEADQLHAPAPRSSPRAMHSTAQSPESKLIEEVRLAYKQLPPEACRGRLSSLEFPWYLRAIEERIREPRRHMFEDPHGSIEARAEAIRELRALQQSLQDLAKALPQFHALGERTAQLRGPWAKAAQQQRRDCERVLESGHGSELLQKTQELEQLCRLDARAERGSWMLALAAPVFGLSALYLHPGLLRKQLQGIINRPTGLDSNDREFLGAKLEEAHSPLRLLACAHEILSFINLRTSGGAQEVNSMRLGMQIVAWSGITSMATILTGVGLLATSSVVGTGCLTLALGSMIAGGWTLHRLSDMQAQGRLLAAEYQEWRRLRETE